MHTGFIGLGAMGVHMARNLHAPGFLRSVWNRNPAPAAAFARATGVRVAQTPGELAGECAAVVMCVADDDAVEGLVDAMLEATGHDLAGKLVIDCSTVAADTARRVGARIAEAGGDFLDCPVTGGTEGARDARLSILVGGSAGAFAQARPLLEAMGRTIAHVGPTGAGQAAKAVNQIMVAGINQAVSEAMAFADAEQLPLDVLIETLAHGAAGSWFLQQRGPNMARGEYPLGFKVSLHQKDLEICRAMALTHGVQLPIVEMTLLHYRKLLAQGAGEEEDISSLHRLKQAMFRTNKP